MPDNLPPPATPPLKGHERIAAYLRQLDAMIKDTQSELISVTNQAIESGQLTPYRRNTAGIAGFVGGAATIAESADQRFRQLLSPDQVAAMEQSGFDMIEYLAFTSPWESVNPPPAEKP